MIIKGRTVLFLLGWVALLSAPATAGGADEPPADLPGTIHVASYAATAFSYHDTGSLLWLTGPDGILRLEVRRGSAGADLLTPMLQQHGQGWTAILSGRGNDTFNAWGEEWHRPAPGVARAAQLVTTALLVGPPLAAQMVGPWRAGKAGSGARVHRIPTLSGAETAAAEDAEFGGNSDFHDRMATLGLGRGGADELLVLAWRQPSDRSQARLQARATRRPGHLELALTASRAVQYAMPEAFVPLWPLAQLVTVAP